MKNLIKLVVFVGGAVLMSLEILAGRTLAPFYGDTVFLWGAVIGFFLLSLSLGYHLGGRLADRRPEVEILSGYIFLAGILIFIIPFSYEHVVEFFNFLNDTIEPIATVLALYFIPSFLHGFVSPFAIKISSESLDNIGTLSGGLYSLATAGSVFGTFLTAFVLIPFVPVNIIYFSLATILLLSAAALSVKNRGFFTITLIFILVISFFNFDLNKNLNGAVVIESLYGQVRVEDEDGIRSLYLDDGAMTEIDLNDPQRIVKNWEYVGCMEFPFFVKEDIKSVLSMGLGGGSHQKRSSEKYPIYLDAVEINKDVIRVAKDYFDVEESENFKIFNEDARVFLKNSEKKYDLIVVDIFHHTEKGGYKIPAHLVTQEFFQLVQDRLNVGGIFAMNFSLPVNNAKENEFFQHELKTIDSVFENRSVFDCGTQVVFSSNKDYQFESLSKEKNIWGEPYEITPVSGSRILTDNFSLNFSELIFQN